jgi:hypothetical protein
LRSHIDGSKTRIVPEANNPKLTKWLEENTLEVIVFTSEPIADYRTKMINYVAQLERQLREQILSTDKIGLAGLRKTNGELFYSEAETDSIFYTAIAFRDETVKLKSAIESASDYDAIDTIVNGANYPTEMVT